MTLLDPKIQSHQKFCTHLKKKNITPKVTEETQFFLQSIQKLSEIQPFFDDPVYLNFL